MWFSEEMDLSSGNTVVPGDAQPGYAHVLFRAASASSQWSGLGSSGTATRASRLFQLNASFQLFKKVI